MRARLLAAAALLLPTPALADTLIDNINGISVDRNGTVTRFEAMLIDEDGKIVEIVERGERAPRGDFRENGRGRTVIPGLIDAHAHVMGLGLGLLTVDLSDTRTLAEAQAKIAAYAAANPERPWIVGRGWNQEVWGLGRFPTAAELDAAVADRPVWLERVDGHAGWANTAALTVAGVTAATADPAGGRIERLPATARRPACSSTPRRSSSLPKSRRPAPPTATLHCTGRRSCWSGTASPRSPTWAQASKTG
jgi:predicted amidohydrolase YtcJ